MVHHVNIAIWKRHFSSLFSAFLFYEVGEKKKSHYRKQLCTVEYTTASERISKERWRLTSVQHHYFWQKRIWVKKKKKQHWAAGGRGRKVQVGLRRVGWAECGAKCGTGGIRAAVVAQWSGPCAARCVQRAAASLLPLQHGWLEVGVAASVLHQVVTAHKALVAQWAAKLLFSCVCAIVACQLIRAGKLLTAVRPGARKGPFSCITHKHTHTQL